MHRLLLFCVALIVTFTLFSHLDLYIDRFDSNYWLSQYESSRYVLGDKGSHILSDAEYYMVRGYQLVAELTDPQAMLPSHPLLGTYLIGISIVILGNPFYISLISSVAALYVTYLIARELKLSPLVSALTLLILVSHRLFYSQLTDTLLDIHLLTFSLLSILFYLRWFGKKNPKLLLLSQLFLGLAFATKFWPVTAPLAAAQFLSTVFTKDFKKFKKHLLSLFAVAVGYALGHLTYFFYHPSPIDFIRYQRYINSWWAGSPQTPPGQVWDFIINNRWHTWWAPFEVVSSDLWSLSLPILVLTSLLLPIRNLVKKVDPALLCLYLWNIFSLFMFSFSATYPRHLLTILPAAILLTLYSLHPRRKVKINSNA